MQEAIVGHIAEWTHPEQRPRPSFDERLVAPSALHSALTGAPVRPMSLTVAMTSDGRPAGPPISLPGPLVDSSVCADNKSVLAACVTGTTGIAAVYDIATGRSVFPSLELTSVPLAVAARPDSSQAAVLCAGGHLIVIVYKRTKQRLFELRHEAVDEDSLPFSRELNIYSRWGRTDCSGSGQLHSRLGRQYGRAAISCNRPRIIGRAVPLAGRLRRQSIFRHECGRQKHCPGLESQDGTARRGRTATPARLEWHHSHRLQSRRRKDSHRTQRWSDEVMGLEKWDTSLPADATPGRSAGCEVYTRWTARTGGRPK